MDRYSSKFFIYGMMSFVMRINLVCLMFCALICLISVAVALPNPAPIYCENMGYVSDGANCVFDDGKSCELWEFYYGNCGELYVKELSCREEGGLLTPGYECCEGLNPMGNSVYVDGVCGTSLGSWFVCAACGDDVCDERLENVCNCPEDCIEEVICPVPNCVGRLSTVEYDENGCIIYECPEEYDDSIEKKCAEAGEEGDIFGEKWGQAAVCCSGLKEVALSLVPKDGNCPDELLDCGTQFLCINCGDGQCGLKENICNCPEDCENIGGGPIQYGICGDNICDYGENTSSYPYYCPGDCKVGEVKVYKGGKGAKLVIKKQETGQKIIEGGKVNVSTFESLNIVDSELVMETLNGRKVIFSPDKILLEAKIENVTTMELIQELNRSVYLVSGVNGGRLFFLFPVSLKVEKKMDAEIGKVISTKKAWWSFFVF